MSPPLYICISGLFSYLLLTVFALIASVICNMTENPSALTGMLAFVTLLVTAAVSSFVITRVRGSGGIICGVLAAALFVVIRIVISLFMMGTDLSDLLDCICYLGTAAVFSFISQKTQRHKRK